MAADTSRENTLVKRSKFEIDQREMYLFQNKSVSVLLLVFQNQALNKQWQLPSNSSYHHILYPTVRRRILPLALPVCFYCPSTEPTVPLAWAGTAWTLGSCHRNQVRISIPLNETNLINKDKGFGASHS